MVGMITTCLFSLSAYATPVVVATGIILGVNRFLLIVLLMNLGHLILMFSVLHSIYALGGYDRRYLPWHGLACLGVLYVLCTAMGTCFTRRVVWRGVLYNGSTEIVLHEGRPGALVTRGPREDERC
jgi:hypothetical protein